MVLGRPLQAFDATAASAPPEEEAEEREEEDVAFRVGAAAVAELAGMRRNSKNKPILTKNLRVQTPRLPASAARRLSRARPSRRLRRPS